MTEYIAPFIRAAFSVIEEVLDDTPTRGQLSARESTFAADQCSIIVGITGEVTGVAVYAMDLTTAQQVASRMLGRPVTTFDQLASSAVAELTTMITGNAAGLLAETGYACEVSPPAIVRGSNVQVRIINAPMLEIPIETRIGRIDINVSLRENLGTLAKAA